MGAVKTANEMIAGVKRRASLPGDGATFSDDDFLSILNEELLIGLLSTIMKVHEEFYVYPYRVAVTNDETEYIIPHRSIGQKIRLAELVDSSGNFVDLTRIKPEDRNRFINNCKAFYLQGNKMIFMNAPQTGTVQMDIFFRPNQLVKTERGSTITAIDTDTGIITFSDTLPTHFTSDIKYDFVQKTAPCKILNYDLTASAIDTSAKTLTFTSSEISDELSVGDYVTIAEETIVPQMPIELVPILEQMAAIYCLESIGDFEAMAMSEKKLKRMQENIYTVIDNRTEGNPQKINNTNSLLRRKRYKIYRGS